MRICVIIPVCNEARAIKSLVEQIVSQGFDVFVIDDGSSDQSSVLAEHSGAKVLSNPKRSGKGFSLRQGFNYAIENKYDAVITMDGDGQHAPEDLKKFVNLAVKDDTLGVINGNRMDNADNMPRLRFFVNRFMSWMISLACRQTIFDSQCGFRFIRMNALKKMNLKSNNFEIETEILMQASKNKTLIGYVPIKTIYSLEKSHINPIQDTSRFITFYIKQLFRSDKKS